MTEVNAGWNTPGNRSATLFLASGGLLLVQVFLIGLRKFHLASFSELWIAPPAIASMVAGIIGLIGLYRQHRGNRDLFMASDYGHTEQPINQHRKNR